jgi:hypothetical protein
VAARAVSGMIPILPISGKSRFHARHTSASYLICHCSMGRSRQILVPSPCIIDGGRRRRRGRGAAAGFYIIFVDVRPDFVHVLYVFGVKWTILYIDEDKYVSVHLFYLHSRAVHFHNVDSELMQAK